MRCRSQNVTFSISHLFFIALVIVVTLAGGFAQSAFAQGTTVVPPPPPIEREPGSGKGLHQAEQDLTDPEKAFDSETGQNLYWDCIKKTWVDGKTGKALGFQGARAKDGEVIPPPPPIEREPGSGKGLHQAEQDLTDPEKAFDSETGQNLYWDRNDKTWKDGKTGKSLGFKGARVKKPCSPQTATTEKKVTKEKKESCDLEFGYNYMRAPDESAKNLNGFGGSLFCNVKPWIAIGGDFGALFGSRTISGITTFGPGTVDVSLHRQTYLFGPQFNFYPNDKVKVFVHPLFGGVHDTNTTTVVTTSTTGSASAFAMAFGGGLDVNLNNHFAVRPIQFDYVPTHFGGAWQSNYRISTGLVIRFGGKK